MTGRRTGKIVKDRWIASRMKIENGNYKEMLRYIAICSTRAEIGLEGMARLIPIRRHKKGPKPGKGGK